jgi:hypothetical protein
MDLNRKKRGLQGLVGGVGVVVALGGFVGGYYPIQTTIVATFGIWIIGGLVVNVICD